MTKHEINGGGLSLAANATYKVIALSLCEITTYAWLKGLLSELAIGCREMRPRYFYRDNIAAGDQYYKQFGAV